MASWFLGGGCLSLILALATVLAAWLASLTPWWVAVVLLLLGVILLPIGFKTDDKFKTPFFRKPDLALNDLNDLNAFCPGCQKSFTDHDEMTKEEDRIYGLAAGMLQYWRTSGLRPLDEIAKEAKRVAELSYRLPYLCGECHLQFCAACTGGPDIKERVCPDCGKALIDSASKMTTSTLDTDTLGTDNLWSQAIEAANMGRAAEAVNLFASAIRKNPWKYCGVGSSSWRPAKANQELLWLEGMKAAGFIELAEAIAQPPSLGGFHAITDVMKADQKLEKLLEETCQRLGISRPA